MRDYELLDHTADLAFRIKAQDMNMLFVKAARALTSILIQQNTAKEQQNEKIQTEINLEAPDKDILLIDWLKEILYYAEQENCILAEIVTMKVQFNKLAAVVLFNKAHIVYNTVIKAITYNDIRIHFKNGSWQATVTCDI